MAVWRRTAGVKSTCKKAGVSECLLCVHKDTQEREWACGCEGMGGQYVFVWVEIQKKKNSISEESTPLKDQIPPYSSSLHLSLKRPPAETEASNCFGCIFRLESSPAATNRLLLTVLFEQLQQGNVSTAFQAQALCGYVSVFYQAFRCINTQTGSTQHAL